MFDNHRGPAPHSVTLLLIAVCLSLLSPLVCAGGVAATAHGRP